MAGLGLFLKRPKRPKVSDLNEMVIKRRLGAITLLIAEYKLQITLIAPSEKSKADALTKVPQKWLKKTCLAIIPCENEDMKFSKRLHKNTVLP